MSNNVLGVGLAFLMGGIVAFGAIVILGKMLFEHAIDVCTPRRGGSHADSNEKDRTDG